MIREKADILFLIMGGNPFPNLISATTRINKGGRIICICTEDTEGHPYNRFRRLVKEKMNNNITIEKLLINKFNRRSIEEKIQEKLDNLLYMEDKINLLELNYTGGIKLISITAYHVIKNYNYDKYNKNPNISLTYIDPERELLYFEFSKGTNKKYISDCVSLSQLDSNFDLNIKDIISVYSNIDNMEEINEEGAMPKAKELANKLGNLFCGVGKKQYDERVKFIKENTATGSWTNDKKQFINNLSQAFLDYNIFSNNDEINLLLGSNDEEIFGYFAGTKWLEEYILNILIELKEEGIIEDVQHSIKKIRSDEEQGVFEVDLVAYRKYKLFAISITSISTQEEAKGKLYEIKQRAKNLAGDEAGICYINLCWDTDELKREYKNIWDDETLENTLILGVQDFSNLKNELREWLKEGV
ncbi:MAG TPA: DUF1887 family protein [Clostridiales bacterium]|nr:DUF1887 family protein [Clostridiales bacterium]